MAHDFPEETVSFIYRAANSLRNSKSDLDEIGILDYIIRSYESINIYGFRHNILTGNYAPYHHEILQGISNFNCTTVIPTTYLEAEALGLKPEIVQFTDFSDLTYQDYGSFRESEITHFALIVHDKNNNQYLADVFWNTFGMITEWRENQMAICGQSGRPNKIRSYKKIDRVTAKEFAAMMERLKDPGESLDMLVAGQCINSNYGLFGSTCSTNISYDDDSNTISTRIYIPQLAISDKAIICRIPFDNYGNAQYDNVSYELYHAKGAGWKSLISSTLIGRCSLADISTIDVLSLETVVQDKSIAQLLANDEAMRESIFRALESAVNRTGPEAMAKLRYKILARTLYEARQPSHGLIYSEDEIKAYFKDNMWKVETLKRDRPELYEKNMNMAAFSETIKGRSIEDIEAEIRKSGLDTRIGHLAMLADFSSYLLQMVDELTLQEFIGSIQEKVRTRRKKYVRSLLKL